jgi:GH24 family phage-related lysozyme (muramidase)
VVKVEGERLLAYRDTNGTSTIGVGHSGLDVTPGLRITPETSRQFLLRDLARARLFYLGCDFYSSRQEWSVDLPSYVRTYI